MNAKNQSSLKKIIFSLTVIFLSSFSLSLFAQENIRVLDQTSMTQVMDANKNAGKPSYDGIKSKFVITTSDAQVSKADSVQIVASILKMPEVLSCVYHPSKHSVVVKTKKQENVNEISNLKYDLANFKVYVKQNEEIIYTEKK